MIECAILKHISILVRTFPTRLNMILACFPKSKTQFTEKSASEGCQNSRKSVKNHKDWYVYTVQPTNIWAYWRRYCSVQNCTDCFFSSWDPVVHYTVKERRPTKTGQVPDANEPRFPSHLEQICWCSTGRGSLLHPLVKKHEWKFPFFQVIWTLETHMVWVFYTYQCWAPAKCK